ncbi:DUF29 family protein [Cronbergia sp. UHCC 0137]|uniref:DUF29 family protein n=1 Tax=Cronbergia sp. UHCC 0137 TaxID=3110239 RepID=UPI002B21BDC9|nr:DUF29 family protein [Cronbergia sp. UHCC 0137]MEA5618061.1 DUF29 family protein [Cronbergia sp. UHCC 0137]
MEELIALRELLQTGNLSSALLMIDEMEEMSKKDILNQIRSYSIILLLHLIKQKAENRTTRSWEVSIRNSTLEIQDLNARPNSKGNYLNNQELRESLDSGFRQAINQASLEVNEGRYDVCELEKIVDKQEICDRAMMIISSQRDLD